MNAYKISAALYYILNHEPGIRDILSSEIAKAARKTDDEGNLVSPGLRDILAAMIRAERGNSRYLRAYKAAA